LNTYLRNEYLQGQNVKKIPLTSTFRSTTKLSQIQTELLAVTDLPSFCLFAHPLRGTTPESTVTVSMLPVLSSQVHLLCSVLRNGCTWVRSAVWEKGPP
jgi:hypothetical protein